MSLEKEAQGILDAFSAYVNGLPAELKALASTTTLWRERGRGLSLLLPFWLNDEFAGGRLLPQAREMALANRFGQVFCLLQDGLIDGHPDISPEVLLPLDAFYFKSIQGYQRLFSASHSFWGYFEEYWLEYLQALAWEVAHHRGHITAYTEEDFLWLGRKFSPLKLCCAGMALLAGRAEDLPPLCRLIEHLQIGIQLMDDLEDCAEDLLGGDFTYPLTLAHLDRQPTSVAPLPVEEVERRLWSEGLAEQVLKLALDNISLSLKDIEHLSLPELKRSILRIEEQAQDQLTKARQRGDRRPTEVKVFRGNGKSLVLNVSTSALYEVDRAAADFAERMARRQPRESQAEDQELLQEFLDAGLLASLAQPQPTKTPELTTLYLNVSVMCNLACSYCYAASEKYRGSVPMMGKTVGEKAVDLLLQSSGQQHTVRLVFFGGEPLLNSSLITHLVDYGRRQAELNGKEVEFRLVTNGTLLTRPMATVFRRGAVAVEVSLDGHQAVQDRARRTTEGEGTYQRVVENVRALAEEGVHKISIRATIISIDPPPVEILEHLLDLRLGPVSMQYVQPVRDQSWTWSKDELPRLMEIQEDLADYFLHRLQSGEIIPYRNLLQSLSRLARQDRYAYYCAAGVTMACVAPNGTLYPCFRFSEEPSMAVGDVYSGIDGEKVRAYCENTVDQQAPCRDCWARYLCGGSCRFDNWLLNGHISLPAPEQCELTKHSWEVVFRLYADILRQAPEIAERIGRDELAPLLSRAVECDQ